MNYKEIMAKIESRLYKGKNERVKSQMYGYFTTLILSKTYAPKNSDLKEIMEYFGMEFLPYVYKSRTILLSRVIRQIEKKDDDSLIEMYAEFKEYLDKVEKVSDSSEDENSKMNKEDNKKKRKNIFDDIFNQLG